MNLVGKSFQHANIVFVLPSAGYSQPEPHEVLAMYTGEEARGSNFWDDTVMKIKIFNFPALHYKIIFEENRLRVEDESGKEPSVSKLGQTADKVLNFVLPKAEPTSFGFNFDIYYRFDQVIPQREIMKPFLKESILEDIKDFGWQFSLNKKQGQKLEVYYCKNISPLEIALHTNQHFNQTKPDKDEFQKLFEQCYNEVDSIFKHLSF